MGRALRPVLLAAAVCAGCLAASAIAFAHASLNRSVDSGWHLECAVVAFAVLSLAAASRLLVLELAAAAVAGGLLANSLGAGVAGGVADFVHAGGWLYSPGDLAVVVGTLLLCLAVLASLAQPLIAAARPGDSTAGSPSST